ASNGQISSPFTIAFSATTYLAAAHDGEPEQPGNYFYHRTGANAAILLLNHDGGNGLRTTVVQLSFSSLTGGTFTFESGGGNSGRGIFTVQ
ncbi:MAG: hypothetical protein DME26_21795, partial [Verrucomicrobia bacterium]